MPEQGNMTQGEVPVRKKKGVLGCSFPVFIILLVAVLGLVGLGFASGALGESLLEGVHLPSWLTVHLPEIELPAHEVFSIGSFPVTSTILASWLTVLVLLLFSFLITRRMKMIPGRLQGLLEFAIESLLGFCESIAGKENGRRFFPIVATIFFFVMFNGWLSLFPGFGTILIEAHGGETHLLRGANTDINTPLAIALISFVFVEFYGLKTLKLSYLKKFINVGMFFTGLLNLLRGRFGEGLKGIFMGIINIFIGLVETLSEFVRIVSFTLRLFGNMTAGEILLLMVTFLVPFVIALPFYGLELLVGFIQAFIFAGLTLIFLTVAVTPHEHEEHEDKTHH